MHRCSSVLCCPRLFLPLPMSPPTRMFERPPSGRRARLRAQAPAPTAQPRPQCSLAQAMVAQVRCQSTTEARTRRTSEVWRQPASGQQGDGSPKTTMITHELHRRLCYDVISRELGGVGELLLMFAVFCRKLHDRGTDGVPHVGVDDALTNLVREARMRRRHDHA